MSSSSQERLKREEELSDEDKASISHQRRVWQVRKYCQVKPSISQYSLGSTDLERTASNTVSLRGKDEPADPALAAFLRDVLRRLDADVVRITENNDRGSLTETCRS